MAAVTICLLWAAKSGCSVETSPGGLGAPAEPPGSGCNGENVGGVAMVAMASRVIYVYMEFQRLEEESPPRMLLGSFRASSVERSLKLRPSRAAEDSSLELGHVASSLRRLDVCCTANICERATGLRFLLAKASASDAVSQKVETRQSPNCPAQNSGIRQKNMPELDLNCLLQPL